MSQFVRRWQTWEGPGTPSPAADRTDARTENTSRTAAHPTDETDKCRSVGSVSSQPARARAVSRVDRCERCLELEAKGVVTLFCSGCGYAAESPARRPFSEELAFSASYVKQQVPLFSAAVRESFDYWLDVYLSHGWSREETERAAFRQTLRAHGMAAKSGEPGVRPPETATEGGKNA